MFAGFAAAVVAVILMAVVSNQAQLRSAAAADAVTQDVELIIEVQNVLSSPKDAETGQRGSLITGDDAYLAPFTSGRAAIQGDWIGYADSPVKAPSRSGDWISCQV